MRFCRSVTIVLIATLAGVMAVPAVATDWTLNLVNSRIPDGYGKIVLTRAKLLELDQRTIRTSNIYIDGVAEFRGPGAYEVIDFIGRAGADTVRITTATDTFIDVTLDELRRFGPILAMEMNGEPLTRRNRGPLWLIYPVDDFSELEKPTYYNRLIAHVQEMELR